MARSDGSVIINTLLDTQGFGKGVKSMKGQMNGLTSAVGKLGAAIGLAFGVKALVDFGKSAIELGSDLQEVQNVVDVTFTTMSESVNEFAKNAAEAAGLSETMAKKYMGTFGAMSKAFGFMEDEAFAMSSTLTQAVGDVASFYNLTQDEAYTKLKSVFTGETESLKDLGVVMTQAALDSYAIAKGYGKTTKEMSEQEKVALRYAFVLDQLSASQGDFVRTSDSWANQTRILSLNFDTLKANIGQALINIFTPFLKVLNQIVDKMAQLSQRFVEFSEALVGKSTSGGGGSPGEAVAEIAQGFDDVTDATKEAEKAQKKYLSGLDELRTFTKEETTLLSGSTAGGIEAVSSLNTGNIGKLSNVTSALDKTIERLVMLIKNGDWAGVGGFLSDGIVGGLDYLSEKLEDFDWRGLGKDIGDFLSGIDWLEIIKSAFKLKFNIWKAIADIWFGAFEAAPIETAIITAIAALKFTGLGATFATIGTNASTAFLSALTAGFIGFNLGQWFYEFLTGEDITLSAREQFQKIKDSLTDGSWKEALRLWGEDIAAAFEAIGQSIVDWWNEYIASPLEKSVNGIINGLKKIRIGASGGSEEMSFSASNYSYIPKLATGAVIPPNAPFMAVLGDQKSGTNIEAPLDTIKQAVREVIGTGNGGIYAFTAQINRRVLFEEMIDEAKLRQTTNGRNPFELT